MSQQTNYTAILQQYFGYPSFRGIQSEIIESIGSGRDTLGLMPTGGGKSIAFQVPALAMDGVCIVITPLIALMKDQVEHLHEKGILAEYINSTLSRQRIIQILDNAIYGGIKFLYISPERIATEIFQAKLQYMNVCFITVDEAHCISQWGYDFRPSYLKISEIRDILPGTPVLALTATATEEVIDDIQDRLHFQEHNVYKMSFMRENLIYVVRHTNDKLQQLLHIIRSVPGSAVVYNRDRQGTKDVARFLCNNNISATFYHAGLDSAVKDQRQQDWQQNKYQVMVATNAFGMGIDKPDVRLVIHIDTPDSIEAYYQEAGRAGRDGKRSYAVLLIDGHETNNLLRQVSEQFPKKEYIRTVYDHLAYFFQIAIDTGEGQSFDFDINKFCVTFKHYPSHLLAALSILQRAGYIQFNQDQEYQPRVKFLVSRDRLYRHEALTPIEEKVIETMLRNYGNLFADFGFVEIGFIAIKAELTDDQVHTALKSLSHLNILKYVPRKNVPRVKYIVQRIDSSRLRFDQSVYEDMHERAMKRISSMIDYISSKEKCRSVMLLRYFGEESKPCGKCDICLENRPSSPTPQAALEEIKEEIRKSISSKSTTFIYELQNLPFPKKELLEAITEMHRDDEIVLEGSIVALQTKQ